MCTNSENYASEDENLKIFKKSKCPNSNKCNDRIGKYEPFHFNLFSKIEMDFKAVNYITEPTEQCSYLVKLPKESKELDYIDL